MAKKVLIISYQYPPCASSGVFRTLRFLKNLPDFHWTPVVLTVDPRDYENEPLDHNLIQANEALQRLNVFRTRMIPGINRVISSIRGTPKQSTRLQCEMKQPDADRPKSVTTASVSRWQKIKDALTLTFMIPDKQNGWLLFGIIKGIQIIRKESPGVLYASGRPWTAFLIGSVLKKMTGIPLLIDFRDPWVDNPYNEYEFPLGRKLNTFLEKECVKTADFVIANTEPLRRVFVKKYPTVAAEKFITLTNGYDESEFHGLHLTSSATTADAPIVISHVGTLYSKRSPENFLCALASLVRKGSIPKNKILIQFIGKVEIPGLREKLQQEDIAAMVVFIDHLPKKEALNASLNSDVLLLIQPATQLQVPAKLFEYIRLGRPILAVCGEGATKEILLANNFGRVAAYDDLEDIEKNLYAVYHSCSQQAASERKAAVDELNTKIKQFDSTVLTSQLAGIFDNLAGDRPNLSL